MAVNEVLVAKLRRGWFMLLLGAGLVIGAIVGALGSLVPHPVRNIAASLQGDKVACLYADGLIRISRVPDGKTLAEYHTKSSRAIEFRFDSSGRFLFTCLEIQTPGHFEELLDQAGHPTDTGKSTLQFAVWKTDYAKLVREESFRSRPSFIPSPAGSRLAVWSQQRPSVDVWNLNGSGQQTQTFESGKTAVSACQFASDGTRLAIADDKGELALWDCASAALICKWQAHQGSIAAVSFAPDASKLASCGLDRKVRIWRIDDRTLAATIDQHHNPVQGILFSPDGSKLVSTGTEGSIALWDVEQAKGIHFWLRQTAVREWRFSADSKRLIVLDHAMRIQVLEANHPGNMVAEIATSMIDLPDSLDVSMDTRKLLYASGDIHLINVETGDELATIPMARDEGEAGKYVQAKFAGEVIVGSTLRDVNFMTASNPVPFRRFSRHAGEGRLFVIRLVAGLGACFIGFVQLRRRDEAPSSSNPAAAS